MTTTSPEFFNMADAVSVASSHDAYQPPSEAAPYGSIAGLPVIGVGFTALPEVGVSVLPVSGRLLVDDTPVETIDTAIQHTIQEIEDRVEDSGELDLADASVAANVIRAAISGLVSYPDDLADYTAFANEHVDLDNRMSAYLAEGLGVCHHDALLSVRATQRYGEQHNVAVSASIDWASFNGIHHSFAMLRFEDDPGLHVLDMYENYSRANIGSTRTALTEQAARGLLPE